MPSVLTSLSQALMPLHNVPHLCEFGDALDAGWERRLTEWLLAE
jgi:hypothetical protein